MGVRERKYPSLYAQFQDSEKSEILVNGTVGYGLDPRTEGGPTLHTAEYTVVESLRYSLNDASGFRSIINVKSYS